MPMLPSNVLISEALGLVKNDTPYLALYTSNPTAADTGTEVTGGSYARKSITFGSISGGSMSNTNAINFAAMPTANITHFGIRDASTAGDLKLFGPISAISTLSGDEINIAVGAITVNLTGS